MAASTAHATWSSTDAGGAHEAIEVGHGDAGYLAWDGADNVVGPGAHGLSVGFHLSRSMHPQQGNSMHGSRRKKYVHGDIVGWWMPSSPTVLRDGKKVIQGRMEMWIALSKYIHVMWNPQEGGCVREVLHLKVTTTTTGGGGCCQWQHSMVVVGQAQELVADDDDDGESRDMIGDSML